MKKMLPAALLLCLFFSMSSFVPVRPEAFVMKTKPAAVTFPITGQTGSSLGTLNYSIYGSGSTPYSITFTLPSGGTVGSYMFNLTDAWYATGMQSATGIQAVKLVITTQHWQGYYLEFISPF